MLASARTILGRVTIIVAIAKTVDVVSGVKYEWWQYILLALIWLSAGIWFNFWRKKKTELKRSPGKS